VHLVCQNFGRRCRLCRSPLLVTVFNPDSYKSRWDCSTQLRRKYAKPCSSDQTTRIMQSFREGEGRHYNRGHTIPAMSSSPSLNLSERTESNIGIRTSGIPTSGTYGAVGFARNGENGRFSASGSAFPSRINRFRYPADRRFFKEDTHGQFNATLFSDPGDDLRSHE